MSGGGALGIGQKKTTSGTSGQREATTSIEDIIDQLVTQSGRTATSGTEAVKGSTAGTRVEMGGDVTQTATRTTSGRTDVQQVGDVISEGGGTLQQTIVNPLAIQNVLDQVLGRFSGISQIASGAKRAGVYDATSQASLESELIGKALGEVARLTSPVLTQELTKRVSQGPNISTTGAQAETTGATTVSTPKIIQDIQTQEQQAVSNQIATSATKTATKGTQKRTVEEEETTAGQAIGRERDIGAQAKFAPVPF